MNYKAYSSKKEEYNIKDDLVVIIFPNYYMTVQSIVGNILNRLK